MVKPMKNKEFNLDDLMSSNGIEITKGNIRLVIALIQKQALQGIKNNRPLYIKAYGSKLNRFEIT